MREGSCTATSSLEWVNIVIHRRFEPVFEPARQGWMNWIDELIAKRRREPRRDDLIDGLIHGRMEGRLLTDDEIRRTMMSITLGGVTALADAISNPILWFAVYPEIRKRLKASPELLPKAIEEFLRIEPSATGHPRRATRDTEIRGTRIEAQEQLFLHVAAANRDPHEFPNPHEFDLEREQNRHLTFGLGHHRCLGSNFARMAMRVVFEEILGRLDDLRLVEDDPPTRKAGIGWMIERMPLAFTPGQRLRA